MPMSLNIDDCRTQWTSQCRVTWFVIVSMRRSGLRLGERLAEVACKRGSLHFVRSSSCLATLQVTCCLTVKLLGGWSGIVNFQCAASLVWRRFNTFSDGGIGKLVKIVNGTVVRLHLIGLRRLELQKGRLGESQKGMWWADSMDCVIATCAMSKIWLQM